MRSHIGVNPQTGGYTAAHEYQYVAKQHYKLAFVFQALHFQPNYLVFN